MDELAENFAINNSIYPSAQDDTEYGFKFGFQKAVEILSSKKYSEKDVTEIVMHVLNELVLVEKFNKNSLFPETIYQEITSKCKSLQQTEWDVEFETERVIDRTKIIGSVKGVKGSGNKITTYKKIPKLDKNGCLILKRI